MPGVYTLEGYKGSSRGAAYYERYPDPVGAISVAHGQRLYFTQQGVSHARSLGCPGCQLKGPGDGGGVGATLVVASLLTVAGVGLAVLATRTPARGRGRR